MEVTQAQGCSKYRKGKGRLHLSTKRLSKRKACRERRRLKKLLAAAQTSIIVDHDENSHISTEVFQQETLTNPPTEILEKHQKGDMKMVNEDAEVINNNLGEGKRMKEDAELIDYKHPTTEDIENSNSERLTKSSELHEAYTEEAKHDTKMQDNGSETDEQKIKSNDDSEEYWVVEKVKSVEPEPPVPNGIDFVHFSYVFNQIINLGTHSKIGCGVEHFKINGYQQVGLEKIYSVKCQVCNYQGRLRCLIQDNNTMDINRSAVSTTMLTGGGYSQLEEIMSGMNVSCMSKKMYEKCQDEIIDGFELAAQREMKDAAREERELAIARGDVDKEFNIPCIPVIADGSWMTRSYKGGNYNSLCGMGAIVGYHTKKVLHIGIKNKFCTFCLKAAKQNEQPREHRCFKNWGINQTSTSMESTSILEGFKCSVEVHGLIYSVLVADGDSSAYKKILDDDPYKKYMVKVRKIECSNHLLRNFSRKLNSITTKGPFKELKAMVKQNALRLRTCVKKAAEYRLKEKVTLAEQIKNLKGDLQNVPSHVFGEHKECQKLAYFCTKYSDPEEIDYIPQLKTAGLYEIIEDAMKPLFVHAESLLYGLTNNAVECFNSIIAKFLGGKRINFGRKGSYHGRASAAVVQFNTKEAFSRLSKAMKKVPTTIVKKMEERRKRTLKSFRKHKGVAKTASTRRGNQSCDKDYGPDAEQADVNEASELDGHVTILCEGTLHSITMQRNL